MKMRVFFLIATCVLSTALTSAQENNKHKPPASLQPPAEFTDLPAPTTTKTTAKTTPKTTKPTTTTKSTPTTKPPTTTKSTTTKPPTTTKSTTTKPPTTTKSTTTKPPTTTKSTTPKPTPVPGPTPSPNITIGNFTYREGGTLYVMALMILQIKVNDSKTVGTFIVQPNMTTTNGVIAKDSVDFTLKFKEGNITFKFQRNTTSKAVYVSSLHLNLAYAFKQGVNRTFSTKNETLDLFKAAIGHSYSCKNESIFLGNGVFLEVTQDRVQAFNFTATEQFGQPDLCKADQPDYTVAIAVGIVLLVLIVIVILAYMCSRRRRSDGYQSL